MSKVFDLLFAETERKMSSDALDDMLFGELRDTVFEGESELYNSFVSVLSSPLTDRCAIIRRQEIIRDLSALPHMADSMCDICRKAKDVQAENRKNLYQKIDAQMRLRINYQTVQRIFEYFCEMGELIRGCRFRSADLNQLRDYFSQTDKFLRLQNGLSALTRKMSAPDAYSGEVGFNDLAAFKTMCITDLNPKGGADDIASTKRPRLFRKESSRNVGGKIDYTKAKDIERQVEEITEKAVYDVCRVLAGVYSYFKALFRSLYEQLTFYRATLRYTEYLQRSGFEYCIPEVAEESNKIEASRLYLLPLALKNGTADANDFSAQENRVFVITGYNRGGKTTFLRSLGFAQISAQAGIAVPARSYRCSVFRYISVHFPRGEGKQLSAGLFEDEIKRLKSDMDRIKNHALILMNESFSTTVESEAEQLASDVIAALAHIGSSVFFVTHFYDFAVRIDELNRRLGGGTVAVNLVTRKYEKPNSRTDYQIVRGDPIPNYRIRLQDFI